MDIQQIRVFVALTEEGTMAGAARRLSVTQPAISFALGSLERELGSSLFLRSRTGLALSAKGSELLASAREMLRLAEEIKLKGKETAIDRGNVSIAGRQGFMQHIFPGALRASLITLPTISVRHVLTGEQEEVIDALREGRVDLAFAAAPNIKSVASEVFYEDPVRLAIPLDHTLARKRHLKPGDIAQLDFVLPSRADRLRKPIDRFLKALPKQPRILMETNDFTVMKRLVEQGLCASFVYGHTLVGDNAKVKIVKVENLKLFRELTVLYRRDDIQPHVLNFKNQFIAAAKSVLDSSRSQVSD